MRFVCESCRAQYMINDEKVGPKGVKVRCRKCGYVILVKRGDAAAKGPSASAGADPDDALATQVLQNPLTPAQAAQGGGQPTDTVADLTNPGIEEKTQAAAPSDRSNALLGDADEDEIGAVFDQVLNSGAHSISSDALGAALAKADDSRTEQHEAVKGSSAELGAEVEDRMSTRVLDANTVRKLADETADQPSGGASADKNEKPEKNGASHENDVPQNDWFVAIDEKQTGPLALDKVKEHWDRGEIGPDSLCWRAGFSDWVPLSDVAQLASVLAPRPASKPIVMNAPMPGPSVVSVPVESAFSAGGMMKSVRSEVQVPMGASPVEDTGTWKPSAANALASLVQDEMAALSKPPPKMMEDLTGPTEMPMKGLLDLPSAGEDSRVSNGSNGRASSNGHAGASVDREERPARRPAPPPAPANPYVATPGATYSSPGITQYRPPSNSKLVIMIAAGGGLVVIVLAMVVVWLVASRSAQPPVVIQQPPVQQPVAVAQNTPPPVVKPPPVAPPPTTQPVQAAPTGTTQPPPVAPPTTPEPPKTTAPLPPRTNNTPLPPRTTPAQPPRTAVATATPEPKPSPSKPEPKGDDDEFAKAFGKGDSKETPKSAEPDKKSKPSVYIPPAAGSAASDVKDALGTSDIMEVVMGNKPALAKCVEEQKKREPGVSGKLQMRWQIGTNGKTSQVSVVSEEFKQTYVATCIGGLIKSWTFPKSKTAPEPTVFPFKF